MRYLACDLLPMQYTEWEFYSRSKPVFAEHSFHMGKKLTTTHCSHQVYDCRTLPWITSWQVVVIDTSHQTAQELTIATRSTKVKNCVSPSRRVPAVVFTSLWCDVSPYRRIFSGVCVCIMNRMCRNGEIVRTWNVLPSRGGTRTEPERTENQGSEPEPPVI